MLLLAATSAHYTSAARAGSAHKAPARGAAPTPGVLAEVSPTGLCDSVQQYSGYFKLNTGKRPKNYFYWFFESRNAPKTDPVVMWMTGGPGCSSEVALFGENGPCAVNANGTNTTNNPYSWNTQANLLYIDQPAGTGFSYGTGQDHDEDGVAVDMYDFLQQFMKAHSQYAALDFYAVGESYAGHYVPAVTHEIWKNNQNLPTGAIKINLVGTGVGNGLTMPSEQCLPGNSRTRARARARCCRCCPVRHGLPHGRGVS
jgi:cathepsin A (carboxypeptidase C)